MRKWIRRLLLFVLSFLIAAVGYAVHYLSQSVPVATAYFAKTLCSGVYLSGREPDDVLDVDLALDTPLTKRLRVEIDDDERTVAVSFWGLFESVAVFREGLGCTLAVDVTVDELREQVAVLANSDPIEGPTAPEAPWPDGELWSETMPEGVDATALEAALDDAFGEPDPARPRRTRAVVVVYDGQLVAERYGTGFDADMPLLGWSMTKSLTNALVGILVEEGLLDLQAPADVPEWSAAGDSRAAITLDQLLRMSSGLDFVESYGDPQGDVQLMLFRRASAAAFAAAKPPRTEPDGEWSYSSGTSNIVSRIVRRAVEDAGEDYFSLPRRELFDRIGIRRFVVEPDASGTFVGSSFSYAPARDWARLGLLYLRDGVWNGERILPEGWVTYSTTPTPKAPKSRYGAHFWLHADDNDDLPADTYFMSGFEGQSVTVVPSRKAVIVRLGMSKSPSSWNRIEFLASVLAALPQEAPFTDDL